MRDFERFSAFLTLKNPQNLSKSLKISQNLSKSLKIPENPDGKGGGEVKKEGEGGEREGHGNPPKSTLKAAKQGYRTAVL